MHSLKIKVRIKRYDHIAVVTYIDFNRKVIEVEEFDIDSDDEYGFSEVELVQI